MQGLVGDNADGPAVEPGETDDGVAGIVVVRLDDLAVVDDGLDDGPHVVDLARLLGYQAIEGGIDTVRVVGGVGGGRILHVVGGKIGEQLPDQLDSMGIVIAGEVADAALGGVTHGTAQFLGGYLLPGDLLDDGRAGDVHVARAFGHEDPVGHGGRVDGAAGRGAHDGRDLRDDAGGGRVAEEYLAVTGEGVHSLLDAGTAGIVKADDGDAALHGQVHDLAYLLRVHLAQGPAHGGEVLRVGTHGATVHSAVTGDNTLGGHVDLLHAEGVSSMSHKQIQLVEAPCIEEQVDSLTSC